MRECGRCSQQNSSKARYCNSCGFMLLSALPDGSPLDGGRYSISALLKQGGMGSVYLALDRRLKRDVALKEMLDVLYHTESERQGASERFQAEARMLAALAHPSLPRVTDFFNEGGRHYLAMDFVDGMDLETWLARHGTPGLPEDLVARWGAELAEVLTYLHGQDPPIIYRDLKPSNIMVRKNEQLVLVDFGIARRVYTDIPSRTALGTEGYAPLEQYQGRLDPRSDIYALGATLYHLLTGQEPTPFRFPPIRRVRPDVSEGMQLTLMRCLALEPEGRFDNAQALLESLNQRTRRLDQARPTPALAGPAPRTPEAAAIRLVEPPPRLFEPQAPGPPGGALGLSTTPQERETGSRGRPAESVLDPQTAAAVSAALDESRAADPADWENVHDWKPTPLALPTALPLGQASQALFVPPAARPSPPRPAVAASVTRPSQVGSSVVVKRSPRDLARPMEAAPAMPPVLTWRDGTSMVLIPAGDFWMGAADDDPLAEADEKPQRLVYVDSFYMDRFPVTNAQFERFVRETGYVTTPERRGSVRTWRNPAGKSWSYGKAAPARRPASLDSHPVVCVTWEDAQAYCKWAGKRLPSEAEWEKASRGRDGRAWPWGRHWDPDRCNNGALGRADLLSRMPNIYAGRGTLPAGCFPSGNSPYGLMDMAGNVAEWTEDWYRPYAGSSFQSDACGERYKVVRGGSWWNNEAPALRCARRSGALPDSELPYRGFRCAGEG